MYKKKFYLLIAHMFVATNVVAEDTLSDRADAMSSVEWRDCAGYFWFLAAEISKENEAQNKGNEKGETDLTVMFQALSYMAIYASNDKAKTERKAGLGGAFGRTLVDPKTGGLSINMGTLYEKHKVKAESEGKESYVVRYRDKCYSATSEYQELFLKLIDPQ